MCTPAGFRFSGRALIIIAVAAFIIAGLLLFVAPDTAHPSRKGGESNQVTLAVAQNNLRKRICITELCIVENIYQGVK